jgi:hypothetical protein
MPKSPEAQVVSPRQRQPGRVQLLLVLGSPPLIPEHPLVRKADPLAARPTVIAEIQHRMPAENLDATADQQRQEEYVERVRESNA